MKNVVFLLTILLVANACVPECSKPKAPKLNVGGIVELYEQEWLSLSVENQTDYIHMRWTAPNGRYESGPYFKKKVSIEDAGEYVVACYTGNEEDCPILEKIVVVKVLPTPPKCHPQNNTFERESVTHNFTTVKCEETWGGDFIISGRTTDNFELKFNFYGIPRPGAYIASGSTTHRKDNKYVGAAFINHSGMGTFWILGYESEIIVSDTNGKLTVTICDKEFKNSNYNFSYKGSARLVCD